MPAYTLQGTTQAILQGLFDNLITEPADGMTKVLSMIQGATKSIDLVMYELEDTQIESALVLAEKRGIAVRVLLNEGYYGAQPSKESEAAYQYLQSGGVTVNWAPSYFALTHQKTLIVDGSQALIMTFNLTSQYYSTSRDFGVVDKDQADVSAIEATFDDDWQSIKDTASQGDDLVWSPGADTVVLSMINNSRKSLYIENEEMSDTPVVDALIAAAQRGVTVEVVMTDSSDWTANFTKLKAAGVGVRTYAASASLYIHAKIILADGTSALVGSQNFSASSLKDNRELGIMLSDTNILNSLSSTFESDWNGGMPF
jgi:phosphatidylserine/phosphatidylglycerophosphate/cardiolipin synthase-like enzyme